MDRHEAFAVDNLAPQSATPKSIFEVFIFKTSTSEVSIFENSISKFTIFKKKKNIKTVFIITMFKNSIRKKKQMVPHTTGTKSWGGTPEIVSSRSRFSACPKFRFRACAGLVFRVPSCSLLLCSVVFSCVQLCSVCLFFESIWMCMYLVRREVCKPAPNTLASKFASFL